MSHVLVSLLPLMIGSAVLPTWISLVILLLRRPDGFAKALSFVGAVTAVRLLQGLGAGRLLEMVGIGQNFGASPLPPVLLLLAGAILLGAGIHGLAGEARTAAARPRWFQPLDRAGPFKCATAGAVLILTSPRQWILTLAAVGEIRESGMNVVQDVIAFLVFTVGAESLILGPIVWALINPKHMHTHVVHTDPWLQRNVRRLAGVGSILIGAFFLWKGIAGLLGG